MLGISQSLVYMPGPASAVMERHSSQTSRQTQWQNGKFCKEDKVRTCGRECPVGYFSIAWRRNGANTGALPEEQMCLQCLRDKNQRQCGQMRKEGTTLRFKKKKKVAWINKMRRHWKVLHTMSSPVRALTANTVKGVASKTQKFTSLGPGAGSSRSGHQQSPGLVECLLPGS